MVFDGLTRRGPEAVWNTGMYRKFPLATALAAIAEDRVTVAAFPAAGCAHRSRPG